MSGALRLSSRTYCKHFKIFDAELLREPLLLDLMSCGWGKVVLLPRIIATFLFFFLSSRRKSLVNSTPESRYMFGIMFASTDLCV